MPRLNRRIGLRKFRLACILTGTALIFGGIVLGRESVWVSVVDGWKSRNWPSVQSHKVSNGTSFGATSPFAPNARGTWKSYYYFVGDIYYVNGDYDVHGSGFTGTPQEVEDYRNAGQHLTVYYNPVDPQEAVLKKGISFNRAARYTVAALVAGLILTGFGFYPLINDDGSSRSSKPKKPNG